MLGQVKDFLVNNWPHRAIEELIEFNEHGGMFDDESDSDPDDLEQDTYQFIAKLQDEIAEKAEDADLRDDHSDGPPVA